SVFRWGSGREMVLGSVILLARLGEAVVLGDLSPSSGLGAVAVVGAVAALGVAFRYRARARARELDQAKLLGRGTLARDLQASVAHHVSAIASRAQAGLAASAAQPDAAADALRVIESEASRALSEMRTIVRALRRDEPAELAPSPRVTDLARLAGR